MISPDPADKLVSFQQQKGLEFPMLRDPDLAVTKAYGILNEQNGKMPHPTAIVVDKQGRVSYFRVDEDYKVRPPTVGEILPALDAANAP